MKKLKQWEILVPTHTNDGKKITLEHHKEWDAFVQKLTNGLTIQKPSKGYWLSVEKVNFVEEMIPVKIYCSKKKIKKISDFTAMHYRQLAVTFYLTSKEGYIVDYDEDFKRVKKET